MSIYAMVWAYEQDVNNSGEKFTLVTAAQYCNDEGICWVKQETLAQDMSMDRRSVLRHLDRLENEHKLVERKERRRKDGTRASDLIKLVGFSKVTKRHSDNQQGDKNDTHQGDNLSQQETSGKEETYYEEQSSSSETASQASPVPLEKYITDKLYDRMKEEGIRWTREEYSFHLGRVQDMLEKDNPSDVEIEMLPAALAGEYAFNPKADAVAALKGYRRQKMRELILSGRKDNGVTALKVEKGEYETPFSDQAIKNRDAIRKWAWYLAAFGDRLSNDEIQARLDEAKEQGKGHEETARALTADWLGKDEGEDE